MFLDRCRSWWKRRSWRPRWHLRSPRPPRRPSARPRRRRRRRCRRRCRSRCYGRPPWWCDRHRRTMRQLRQAIHDAMIHEISMKSPWNANDFLISGRSGSFWVKCVISWDFWNGIDSTTKRYQTDIPTSITRNVGFQEYDEQKLQKQLVNLN